MVVNDLGVGPDGRGTIQAQAHEVVQEIVATGGDAIADPNSVADEQTARAVVATALERWGRVDVLINNAGIVLPALFDEVSAADVERMVRVHLLGTIWMCRAVWPTMTDAAYGRIVNVGSAAMLGARHLVVYGAAKAGIYGLTRGLAVEGASAGIKVNAIGPGARTVAIEHLTRTADFPGIDPRQLSPDRVAPAVAVLAHESCEVSGKFINAAAGHVSETYYAETCGQTSAAPTPEWVRASFDTIVDREGSKSLPDPTLAQPANVTPVPYRTNQYDLEVAGKERTL